MRFSHVIVSTLLFATCPNLAQANEATLDVVQFSVDAGTTIDDVISTLRANYVFPGKVPEIEKALKSRLAKGRYSEMASEEALASALSADLIELTGDFHFHLALNPEEGFETRRQDPADQSHPPSILRDARLLPGNVGYLRIDYFGDANVSYPRITSAMNMLSESDAMILDLRHNRGGALELVQFISSYFFDTHQDRELFRYYYNKDGKRIARSQWVLPALPGTRRPEIPLYVLTGSTTFSAGEWMTYMLKNQGRAVIVGATTAGAAHPVDLRRVNSRFVMQIPIGEIRDPLANDDFEGRGIEPNVAIAEAHALDLAHQMAIQKLVETGHADAQWFLPRVKSWHLPDAQRAQMTRDIIGKYEGRSIAIEDGGLVYRWRDKFAIPIEAIGEDIFAVVEEDDYLFELIRKNGEVVGLRRMRREGGVEEYARLD